MDDYLFQRQGKRLMLKIIDYLNEKENRKLKRSGTIDELLKTLRENIPKNERRDKIGRILGR